MTRYLVALTFCAASFAQTFEVASVRVHTGPLNRIAGYSASGARVEYEAWPILLLIMEAYNLKRYQVAFATTPPDADTTYYNIVAKAESADASPDDIKAMLRTYWPSGSNWRSIARPRTFPSTPW